MTATETRIPVCDAVRVALVELLTTGQHHHAATPHTLTQVGDTRRLLAELHHTNDPADRHAPQPTRHAALSSALGDIGRALLAAGPYRHPDTAALRGGLSVLAAVALGWLDTLPLPDPESDDGRDDRAGDYGHDDHDDAPPF